MSIAGFVISLVLTGTPALPPTPAPVGDLIYARHFSVEEGFVFTWRAERPLVREGTIVVLAADPALIRPRQTAEPVLYVGRNPAWRISPYNETGRVVAFVPERVDLTREPIWFGTPELPERVDEAVATLELERARVAGIRAFGRAVVESALPRSQVTFANRTELLQALHALALDHGAARRP